MFIKFTIVLVAVYFLFKGGLAVYVNTFDNQKKIALSNHDYNGFSSNELAVFEVFGLLHITMYICVVISIALVIFKWIGGIL